MEGGGGIPIEPRGLSKPVANRVVGVSDRLARNWREHRHLAFATIAAGRRLIEEGCDLVADSTIIAPIGEVASKALSQDDELVVARCDLDLGKSYKASTVQFRETSTARALSAYTRSNGRSAAGPSS